MNDNGPEGPVVFDAGGGAAVKTRMNIGLAADGLSNPRKMRGGLDPIQTCG